MRKRDARAAIAANAARIRLCVKTVVAGVAQSPGTNEGIRTGPDALSCGLRPFSFIDPGERRIIDERYYIADAASSGM